MIPVLLGNNPASFENNGIGKLFQTISCFVTEQLNGEYSLTMEISFDDPNFQNIQIGSVIAVMPNKTDPRQGFVVEHIGKPIDGICEIYATHIAQYRGKLIPVSPFTASSLANALTAMISNSLETNPFTITTNKTSNVAMAPTIPHTFRELMGGTQGSLIDTYSGEYKYNNYEIQFLNRRGRADTDIQVLYGKNMTDFNLQEDFSWTDSVTGVLPFWSMEQSGTVVGSIQYSPYKDLYPYARTGVLNCTDKFQEKPTAAQLNAYAATYISNKGISSVNMDVSFDHLQFQKDKNLQIGDTVTVINSMYNVNYKRRIVGYTFNVLLEEYEYITIGDLKASISDAVNETFNNSVSDLKLLAENVNYSNATSGLTAINAQSAIDETFITLAGSIATIETSPATANHSAGEYIIYNGQLYKVTTAITAGTTLTGKISAVSVADELDGLSDVKIKSVSYTGTTNAGGNVFGSMNDFGITGGTHIIGAYFQRGSYGAFRRCEMYEYGTAGFGFHLIQGATYGNMAAVANGTVTLTIYYI